MTTHILTAMRKVIALVDRTKLAQVTATLQEALLQRSVDTRNEVYTARSERAARNRVAPVPHRPLGEVLRVLRAGRFDPISSLDDVMPTQHSVVPGGEGTFSSRVLLGSARQLDYMLYRPPTVAGRKLSLLLMLHGCTQNPEDFALGTRMNELADEFGLIVAYPHQPRSANSSGCWNWFDSRHQNRGSGEPALLANLATSLASEFEIPPGRTFAAGLSAGGAMSDVIASVYPEVFAAVGIHSGLPHGAAKDVVSAFGALKNGAVGPGAPGAGNSATRKIVIHGADDKTVHPSNGNMIFAALGRDDLHLRQHNTPSAENGDALTGQALVDAKGGRVAEYWLVPGGGHTWFGGDARGTYTNPVGPDASRMMIRFFLQE